MVKIIFSESKYINPAALVVLMLVAVSIAGCVGAKAPEAHLDIAAKAASGLIISQNGGDPLILKDEKITVKRQVNGNIVDGLDGVPLYGSTPEFQDAPVLDKLTAGQKIRHVWKETLMVGDVLDVTVQDASSGKTILNTQVTVT